MYSSRGNSYASLSQGLTSFSTDYSGSMFSGYSDASKSFGYSGADEENKYGLKNPSFNYKIDSHAPAGIREESLDALLPHHVSLSKEKRGPWYSPRSYAKGLYLGSKPEYHIVVENFLKSDRPMTAWVASLSDELRMHITDAFKATTGEEFGFEKIQFHVLDDKDFRKAHEQFDGAWEEGIRGFSVNRQGKGTDHVFIRNDFLDAMMLTIGHEIGHLMSKTLDDSRDEEAKAFAFSMAWMQTIVENNIAGLRECINPQPARNGLHDVAFGFVGRFISQGLNAIDIFKQLIRGEISFAKQLETIVLN